LIELLIVIAIIGILSAAVLLTINPGQLLAQARDSRRVDDLANLNSAVKLYLADFATTTWSAAYNCTSGTTAPGTSTAGGCAQNQTRTTAGAGWVPINFGLMTINSPISALPIDPSNSVSTCGGGEPPNVYLYAYHSSSTIGLYKLYAKMESSRYQNNQSVGDGGLYNAWYEVGSNLSTL
jgi:type II secretory pathway pseudopilin PulG